MEEPIFKFRMKVRDYELDVQGIVNNSNYQHYFEVARHEFLETCNISFIEAHNIGVDPVVSSITIKYKQSLVSLDQFDVTINLKKKGIRYYFMQKIIRISDNAICAEGLIEVVCINKNGRVIRPDFFDKAFAKYIKEEE